MIFNAGGSNSFVIQIRCHTFVLMLVVIHRNAICNNVSPGTGLGGKSQYNYKEPIAY